MLAASLLVDEVDDDDVADPGRAPLDRRESATAVCSISSSESTTSAGTETSAFGTSSERQSGSVGIGWTPKVAWNDHGSESVSGSSYSYCGTSTGRTRVLDTAFQNQPPIWLSTASW